MTLHSGLVCALGAFNAWVSPSEVLLVSFRILHQLGLEMLSNVTKIISCLIWFEDHLGRDLR